MEDKHFINFDYSHRKYSTVGRYRPTILYVLKKIERYVYFSLNYSIINVITMNMYLNPIYQSFRLLPILLA